MCSEHAQAVSFRQAMDDDFNTPEAIAALFGLATEVNRFSAAGLADQAAEAAALLRGLGLVLGLLARSAAEVKQAGGSSSPQMLRVSRSQTS